MLIGKLPQFESSGLGGSLSNRCFKFQKCIREYFRIYVIEKNEISFSRACRRIAPFSKAPVFNLKQAKAVCIHFFLSLQYQYGIICGTVISKVQINTF